MKENTKLLLVLTSSANTRKALTMQFKVLTVIFAPLNLGRV